MPLLMASSALGHETADAKLTFNPLVQGSILWRPAHAHSACDLRLRGPAVIAPRRVGPGCGRGGAEAGKAGPGASGLRHDGGPVSRPSIVARQEQ